MIYPSIDKILNIVDSKYQLVTIISKRSKEMTENGNFQKPVNRYASTKNLGRALEEVSERLLIIRQNKEED